MEQRREKQLSEVLIEVIFGWISSRTSTNCTFTFEQNSLSGDDLGVRKFTNEVKSFTKDPLNNEKYLWS